MDWWEPSSTSQTIMKTRIRDLFDLAKSYIPDKFLNSFLFLPKGESLRNFVPGQLEFRNQVVKCWLREELIDFTRE